MLKAMDLFVVYLWSEPYPKGVELRFLHISFALLVGFSLLATASEEVNFPADWGKVSTQGIAETNCPSLNGVFAELGWAYRVVNGVEDTNLLSDVDSYRILRDNETRFKRLDLSQDSYVNSFSIKQNNETSFILTRFDKRYWNDVVSTDVSNGKDKLACNNGWWTIVSDDTGRKATEGHTWRMQFDRRFTRLDNKDLVVHERYIYERTDWFILKNTRFEDTFYRYRYIKDSVE